MTIESGQRVTVREFLRNARQSKPNADLSSFILLRELSENERVHGRLPHRLWLVLFNNAGADKPYAILKEYDDDRGLVEDGDEDRKQIDAETLRFWIGAQRRVGDW